MVARGSVNEHDGRCIPKSWAGILIFQVEMLPVGGLFRAGLEEVTRWPEE